MSLQVDSSRRSRSRSPLGRSTSSSRILSRLPSGRDRDRDADKSTAADRTEPRIQRAPYPGDDDSDNSDDGSDDRRHTTRIPDYEQSRDSSARAADNSAYWQSSRYGTVDAKSRKMGRRERECRFEKERLLAHDQDQDQDRARDDIARAGADDLETERRRLLGKDKFDVLPAKYAKTQSDTVGRDKDRGRGRDYERTRKQCSSTGNSYERVYGEHPDHEQPRSMTKGRRSRSRSNGSNDAVNDDLVYGASAVPENSAGGRWPSSSYHYGQCVERLPASRKEKIYHRNSYSSDPRCCSGINVLTVEPASSHCNGGDRDRSRSPMPELTPDKEIPRLSVNNLSSDMAAPDSCQSVSAAPGSPLLESYQGTYQSMSPMPSPMLLASQGLRMSSPPDGPLDWSDEQVLASPVASGSVIGGGGSNGREKIQRRARFYDPETDTQRLAKALRGERQRPDVGPLIEILPGLTHEQVMELRSEYKRIVKTGPERKGVNVAKHIKARLKDEDAALMKACYTTALGRWESEAYWANFWYHGDKTRRELLIESLMGRTNDEIHRIKKGFSDKKYSDSLSKCMRTELKEDKFKRAILFVLDEQRMDEFDRDGRPLPVDMDLVRDDVANLYCAVRSERGGESATINVVVQRSDSHLREVLRQYNVQYQRNFARDCLRKSGNLVGEMLAHILNGVINKPVRDAALVHHALTASKKDGLRRELLISRLIRFHWDRHHMAAIKTAYRSRYGGDMQEAIRDATVHSDWGLFCSELCIARHPDEVKRVERIVHR